MKIICHHSYIDSDDDDGDGTNPYSKQLMTMQQIKLMTLCQYDSSRKKNFRLFKLKYRLFV